MHVRKQEQSGQHIQCSTVSDVQITSWAEGTNQITVHLQRMTVGSIYKKEVANSKSKKKLKGRLFYAIVPNHKTKTIDFYFSQANAEEEQSVARCLALLFGIFTNWILVSFALLKQYGNL